MPAISEIIGESKKIVRICGFPVWGAGGIAAHAVAKRNHYLATWAYAFGCNAHMRFNIGTQRAMVAVPTSPEGTAGGFVIAIP